MGVACVAVCVAVAVSFAVAVFDLGPTSRQANVNQKGPIPWLVAIRRLKPAVEIAGGESRGWRPANKPPGRNPPTSKPVCSGVKLASRADHY